MNYICCSVYTDEKRNSLMKIFSRGEFKLSSLEVSVFAEMIFAAVTLLQRAWRHSQSVQRAQRTHSPLWEHLTVRKLTEDQVWVDQWHNHFLPLQDSNAPTTHLTSVFLRPTHPWVHRSINLYL